MAIKVLAPYITERDVKAVTKAVKTGWVCNGAERKLFEESFAKYCGVKYAISTCNGTSALHLSLLSLGIGKGDEVIVPAMTYAATIHAVSYTGATPVIVDVLPDGNMDPSKITLTPRTKAIIGVHLYGNPCNMMALTKFGVPVIEDACEAIGAIANRKRTGSLGKLGAFSFYGNKAITTGEGGMITTNDLRLYQRISHLKNHCMTQRYSHDGVGYNYEMSNLNASLGLSQLSQIDTVLARKRHIFDLYDFELAFLKKIDHSETSSRWLYSISTEYKDELITFLTSRDIETRPFFTPLNKFPHYQGECPVAESLHRNGICLPTDPNMTDKDIYTVINSIKTFYADKV